MARIELSDMIAGLRQELVEAQKKAAKEDLRFTVETIDLEAQVTVAVEGELSGLARFKFLIFGEGEASVKAGASRETVQTIRLTLRPDQTLNISRAGKRPE